MYLAELRESHKHPLGRAGKGPSVCVKDVVIVHDEGLPRSFWKLGRIKKLIVGKDGQRRGATVRVASKGPSHITLNGPLQLLYPQEIRHPPDPKTDHPDLLNSSGDTRLENVPGETDHSACFYKAIMSSTCLSQRGQREEEDLDSSAGGGLKSILNLEPCFILQV